MSEEKRINSLPTAAEITDGMLIPIEDENGVTMQLTGAALKAYITGICSPVSLDYISVISPPDKATYFVGDIFDPTGMTVFAHYSDGTSKAVDTYTYDPLEFTEAGSQQVTISYTEGGVKKTIEISVLVREPVSAAIYGVYWDGTESTVWTRTDAAETFVDPVAAVDNGTGSSPFDNIMPWSGMQVVEDAEAGTLVSIPKFWYQITQTEDETHIKVANSPVTGFHVSPAHMDRGDGVGERDMVYVGRYFCNTAYKSKASSSLVDGITRTQARINISSVGSGIFQLDFAMRATIWLLYLVEFASLDSQSVVGTGCYIPNGLTGYTDSMRYHTGHVTSANYSGTQYRYIEGLWDSMYWLDGCYMGDDGLHVIINPNSFSDTQNGVLVGAVSGYKMTSPSIEGYSWALHPTTGSASQPGMGDLWRVTNSKDTPVLAAGGGSGMITNDMGLFYTSAQSSTAAYTRWSARLMKLP